MAHTETSFVVRTTRDALKSHSPSRPPAPCPEWSATSITSLAKALTQRGNGLSKSREERHDLIDQGCSIQRIHTLSPTRSITTPIVSLTYRFPSSVDASPINLMLSACQLCIVQQPGAASQLLHGLLEIWLKVTNVELPQLVIVSQTFASETSHSRPHNP
jgi:hypothetical protein